MFSSRFFTAVLASAWAGTALAADRYLALAGKFEAAGIEPEIPASEWPHPDEDPNFARGGWIRVHGVQVTVPRYIQLAFPVAFVSFPDFFAQHTDFIGYDIEVTGNWVEFGPTPFEPIAAQISMSQTILMGGQGVIQSIDTTSGDITLEEGQVLRIVDPDGAYGPPTGNLHEFWMADAENPTITTFSGFPMCVQSANTLAWCPSGNRPTEAQRVTGFVPADPLAACPFAPGDQLDYSGIEEDGKIFVSFITVNNLNVLTPDTDSSGARVAPYIRVEDALIGVFNPDDDDFESAGDRFVGFLSSASPSNLPVKIQGIKPDFCTGRNEFVDRAFVTELRGNRIKFDWRSADEGETDEYYREYLLRTTPNPIPWNPEGDDDNGKPLITAGQYVMGVSEWIQAELTTPGLDPPPHLFNAMYHLSTGIGWDGEHLWRRLDPFPQSNPGLDAQPGWEECVTARANAPPDDEDPPPTECAVTSDTVTIDRAASFWESRRSGSLTVFCDSTATGDECRDSVSMSVNWISNGQTTTQAMLPLGNGRWSMEGQRNVDRPTFVQCVSGLGGSDSVNGPP